jgi:ABC-type cobalamin/Fe3+-siderophores transport system ATPase subunit
MIVLGSDRLAVRYGSRIVFEGFDLALSSSRLVALVGPNGSGKSSLLRVLAGVQKPDAGSVTSSGKVVLVAPALDPPGDLTPFDLAAYGLAANRRFWQWSLPPDDERRIADALAACNLTDLHANPIATMSAGEVQRAWIATALATRPDVLLIDEPTTHLDLRYQIEVLKTLTQLAQSGVCVMAAIHDLTLAARFADDVALIANGSLCVGPPEEVLEARALSQAYGVEVFTHRHPRDGYLVCLPS